MSNEVKFGIFAIVAIVMIIVGLNYMAGSSLFGPPFTLYAEYPSVQGLMRGNPVTISGLKVGRVSKLALDIKTGRATATLAFEEEYAIPKGSVAMIYSSDLLGSKAVQIVVPDSVDEGFVYEDKDSIRGTVETGIFDVAANMVEDQGAKILYEVAKLSVELREMVRLAKEILVDAEHGNSVSIILDNARVSTENIASLTGKLDQSADQIDSLLRNANRITGSIADNSDNIDQILVNLKVTTDSVAAASGNLRDLVANADESMAGVSELTAKLNRKDNSLGLLMNDRGMYDSLVNTIGSVNRLANEIERNPQRFLDDIKLYLIERKNK